MDNRVVTISIKECSRCGQIWSADRITIEPHDKLNVMKVRIAYCPECAEGFASETDRFGYRRTGKRIK